MTKFTAADVTDADVEAVEDAPGVSHSHGAWDMEDPKDIIAAAWNRLHAADVERLNWLEANAYQIETRAPGVQHKPERSIREWIDGMRASQNSETPLPDAAVFPPNREPSLR